MKKAQQAFGLVPATKKPFTVSDVQILDEYVNSNYSAEEKAALKMPKYFYF